MKKLIYIFILGFVVTSCAPVVTQTKLATYKNIYEEKPVSILALPPINKSTKVEAKELFYSSLAVPFTLQGYYVMPPLLAMEILKEESAYDAEMFINSSMKRVGELFGVDAVLFTTIHEWTKTAIASQIRVRIEYLLKSTKTDEILFNRIGDVTLSTAMNTGNAFADIIGGMVSTALTKEIVVGRNCNIYTIGDIPAGKYSPNFGADGQDQAQAKEFKTTINK